MKKKREIFDTVFNDILNLQNTIDGFEELRTSLSELNFDDVKETEQLITRTKDKITKLQNQINKVDIFFKENCANLTANCETENRSIVTSDNDANSTEEGDYINSSQELDKSGCTIQRNESNHLSASVEEETNSKRVDKNDCISDDSENKNTIKPFLKCVDIKRLMQPNLSVAEAIVITSESEDGNDNSEISERRSSLRNNKKRTIKQNRREREIKREKLGNCEKENNQIDNNISRTSKRIATNADNRKIKFRVLFKKKPPASSSSDSSSSDEVRKESSTPIKNKLCTPIKKNQSSSSSSSSSDEVTKKSTPPKKKSVRFCRNLQDFDDRYFKSYIPLARIPCEKLKEVCFKDNQLNEITRRSITSFKELNNSLPKKSSLKPKSKQRKIAEPEELDSSSSEKGKNLLSQDKSSSQAKTDQADKSDSVPSASKDNLSKEPSIESSENLEEKIESDKEPLVESRENLKEKIESNKEPTIESSENLDEKTESSVLDEKTESSVLDEKTESSVLDDKSSKSSDQEMEKTNSSKRDSASDSDSDSGSDFETFSKKKAEKEKVDKLRTSKKKNRIIIDSDSEGESGVKEKDEDFKQTSEKESSSSSEESEKEGSDKEEDVSEAKSNKRKRIKTMSDSSDEDVTTRKSLRRMIGHDSLTETTKKAEKEEQERKARIAERQKKYNAIFEEDQPIDAVIDKLVLDFDEKTKKEIISVDKKLAQKLKPHQAKGVQFMWDACFESVERSKSTNGSGCILAHCMGLGKTLQVIALIHTLMANEEKTGIQKVLVVAPLNTVLNWVAEFNKWLNDIEPEIEVYELVTSKQNVARQYQVEHWTKHGGVLIIGYDMFRNLTNTASKRLRKSMRVAFEKGFVDPGPDLIICDEGHLLKNEKSNLSIAMNKIRSTRRIVLTGTPMQNNLKEYYCMVQFVKPNLLGTYKEYLNRFVNPITNGQYTDSTEHDIVVMRRRSHVLHKMLDGIIQRKDYSVLMPYLPPKYEYVLFLTLTEVQIKLYQHYLSEYARRPIDSKTMRTTFLFTDFQEFQRICTHPRVLLNKSIELDRKATLEESESESEGSLKDFIDDDSDEAEKTNSESSTNSESDSSNKDKSKNVPQKRLTRNAANEAGIDIEEEVIQVQREQFVQDKWWSQYCSGEELDNIALGSKLHLLFEILEQCELIGDKLLVFSQSLYSLNIIEYFLARIDEATQNGEPEKVNNFKGSWSLGLDYFRLDGSSSCDNRSIWCKHFNSLNNTRARLFLISTRAGGIGINLTGANRVIIFDVSWNPSHDIQSIYRVYRFGQSKPCYIYRFVTNGTMEMKVYERQVTKQAISKRVIDEQQIDRHYNQNDLAELYNFDPKPEDQPIPLVPKDVLLAELIQKEKDRIYKYHEHQTLLENKEDEELNEAERKAAWEEFENEKTARVNMNTGMGWIRNVPIPAITAALYSILSKDNPTWTNEQIQAVVPMLIKQLQDQVATGDILLFNRVVNEIKLMQTQIQNQQRLQNMLYQQQVQALQQRFTQSLNSVSNTRGPIPFPSSSEIVELND